MFIFVLEELACFGRLSAARICTSCAERGAIRTVLVCAAHCIPIVYICTSTLLISLLIRWQDINFLECLLTSRKVFTAI